MVQALGFLEFGLVRFRTVWFGQNSKIPLRSVTMVNSLVLVYAYFTTTAIAAKFSAIFDLVNMSRWGEISLQIKVVSTTNFI